LIEKHWSAIMASFISHAYAAIPLLTPVDLLTQLTTSTHVQVHMELQEYLHAKSTEET